MHIEQNIVYGVSFDIVSERCYISHYIETECCTWSDIWYSSRTSLHITRTLKPNIVHGLTFDTVTEHQYISYVYWNINSLHGVICNTVWELLYFSHYVQTQYCTWSDLWYSFRTTVYLTLYWKTIMYLEWHVIHYQNIDISHTNFETVYFTWNDKW